MKSIMFTVLALALVAVTGPAQAADCARLAQNCMKNGGTRDKCFAPAAMAHCKKTCEMIGPYTGKTFYADRSCGNKK